MIVFTRGGVAPNLTGLTPEECGLDIGECPPYWHRVGGTRKQARAKIRAALTARPGLLAVNAPPTWHDDAGVIWRAPTCSGRLKPAVHHAHAALIDFVIRRDGSRCIACGWMGRTRLVADHIISRRDGGAHHPDNLQSACDSCNAAKVGMVDVPQGRRTTP